MEALSHVSKLSSAAVAHILWHFITIMPSSEYNLHRLNTIALPQTGLQLARELHFRASFTLTRRHRCSHMVNDFDEQPDSLLESDDKATDPDTEPFEQLTQKTVAVLRRLEYNQLKAFRWVSVVY